MRAFGSSASNLLLLALSSVGPVALGVVEAQGTTLSAMPQGVQIRTSALSLPARRAIENGEMLAVRANGTVDTIASDATRFELQAGELLMGRVRVASTPLEPRILSELSHRTGVVFPPSTIARDFPLILIENVRGPAGESRIRQLRPYIAFSELQFEPAARLFAGRIHIGLRVLDESEGGPIKLPATIGFTLVTDADSIEPSHLEFREGNGPPLAVRLATSGSLDSVMVRVTRDDLPGFQAIESVPLPSVLWFEGPPKRLQGFGLERRMLRLTVLGRRLATPLNVAVSADEGLVESGVVRLMPAEVATVSLTADALGTIQVTASGQGVHAAEIRIQSTPPIRFLLAAFIGALLGAAAGYFSSSGKKEVASWRAMLGAVLGGLVGAAAAVGLGLNLTYLQVGGPINTTIAVFAFAAIGAMGGLKLMGVGKSG